MEERVDYSGISKKTNVKGAVKTEHGTMIVPELENMVGPPVPWDEIEPIIKLYYKRFAKARRLNDFVKWINNKYNIDITKDALGKRAARILGDNK